MEKETKNSVDYKKILEIRIKVLTILATIGVAYIYWLKNHQDSLDVIKATDINLFYLSLLGESLLFGSILVNGYLFAKIETSK